jgi:hypothetical protein
MDVSPIQTSIVIVNDSQPLIHSEIIRTDKEIMSDEMYRTGGKYLGQEFEIIRQNVSGLKNMDVQIKVYDYKFMPNYRDTLADSWGTLSYWPRVPDVGQKYLFVFVHQEMIGTNQNNDPRMWGFDSSHFAVQYRGQLIQEDPTRYKCVAIKELENTYPLGDSSRISDYGKIRVVSMDNPLSGTDCANLGFLRMGASNAWDGFILYQVPKEAIEKDIVITGGFGDFGKIYWYLHKEQP